MKKSNIGKQLLCLCLVLGILTGVNVFGRRNNYEWQGTKTVYFDNGYTLWNNMDYTNCVKRAMGTWNSVTTSSGDHMVTLLTSGSRSNKIIQVHKPNAGWVGFSNIYPKLTTVPPHTKISYVVVELNTSYNLADGKKTNAYDVQGIIQHELGHCLGIAHCHELGQSPCNKTCINNTMHRTPILNSVEHRYLKVYDKDSKRIIYS